ncbi:MAG TPA: filamentous hemagglutinin N-terminal domain-containing protein [Candidatus Omnitrophota bacterium]|nr:filamentous hemagglutinin N-terminal domain-containing protein [Candidatus Omnitrophota bacterium]HRZ14433.1 filamentous hemagglutinin N-terminal domain-containing protein [Candidatus Omnitrophota bacterium]
MPKQTHVRILIAATSILLSCCSFVYALPEGENVVAGSATFDRSQADSLTVTTPSDKLIVDYNSFNIAAQEAVRFAQPSASAVALNRVVGGDPSSILGSLSANGKVFLINPNGIVFGPGSQVDVAGLVASTLNISNEDFLKGNYVFSKAGKAGYIINQGTITAQAGGYVCLLGHAVDNRMVIQADLGTVVLASGEKMTLSLEDSNAISVAIDQAVQEELFGPDGRRIDSAVKNSGTILAQGGKVILTAKVLNRVFDYAINNTGLVKVTSLVEKDGVIELVAEGAPVVNSGTLEAAQVHIKVSDAGITNAPEGRIVADALSATSPDGGKIALEAATILQQGIISANALEQGTAGEISIVSDTLTVLDENSVTEAQAVGLAGNGGRILVDSKNGNTFVNKNAVIDFSAGAVSGNGGVARVDAFAQLGFYGILNGRAPPGFTPGNALLDPATNEYSGTIGEYTTVTVDAWQDITITGDIFLGYNSTLNLYADHERFSEGEEYFWYEWDTTYDPGIGAIYNAGEYVISATSETGTAFLNMRAGSGIGTMANPILTNVGYVRATINPESSAGDIWIEQDSAPLYIQEIYSPGLVVLTSSGQLLQGDEGVCIEADELYLEAYGGIGDNIEEGLAISVNKLVAYNEGYGGIYLYNDQDLVVLVAENYAAQTETAIYAAGDIRVRYGIISEGDVYLEAQGQNGIILNTLADIVAPDLATVYLRADNGAIIRRNLEVEEYGLRAYWNFDQYYSYYYAQDVSGNGYSAYASGTPDIVPEGIYGQALYFDGINDYFNIGTDFGFGAEPFTLLCWYRGTQLRDKNVGLLGASLSPLYTTGYALETLNGSLQSWVNNDMDNSAIAINDNNWYQVSMVRDGTEGSLYIFNDDVKYGSEFAVPEGTVDTGASFWIGGFGARSRLTEGAIDDVRVYASALSGFEIYSQTLIQPGTGRVSAGAAMLSAASGIDAALNVQAVAAENLGSGDIYISNDRDLQIVHPDEYADGMYNAGGNIIVQAMAGLTVHNDVFTDAAGGSIYLSAGGDILVDNQVSISSTVGGGQGEPVQNAVSGDVTLDAGGAITFNYGVNISSYASGSGPAYDNSAVSGAVSLIAGGNISLDWANISSQARASGSETATATSGNVSVSAGGLLNNIEGSQIFSSADANVYNGLSGSTAIATSGSVTLSGNAGISSVGSGYGADVYSYAHASAGSRALANSSSVILSADSGNIDLSMTDVYSSSDSQTSMPNEPGSLSQAYAGAEYYDYNNYEWSYLAVMIDAGGAIALSNGSHVYADTSAQGEAAQAYGLAGDITIDAGGDITLSEQYLNSEARTYAYQRAESVSGRITVASQDGDIEIPSTAQSNASADVRLDAGEAYATADDIDVHSWYRSVNLNAAVSTAEAYSSGDGTFPNLLQAVTGDVTIYAGQTLRVYYANSEVISEYPALNTSVTAGNVNLAGYDVYLNECYVYSNAQALGGTYSYATAGNVTIDASNFLDVNQDIYSSAQAEGSEYARASSGSVNIEAGSVDQTCAFYSSAIASASDAQAYSGDLNLMINGNYTLSEFSVYSIASVAGTGTLEAESGDLWITAYGALNGIGASIYSEASLYGEVVEADSVSLTAGDVALYSSGDMQLTYTPAQSNAAAYAREYAYASTGNIDITCYGLFSLLGSPDLNSRAEAYASGGEYPQAYAYAGSVSVYGYNGITAQGNPEYEATASFTSWATAEGDAYAYAYASDVSLESASGSISLYEGFLSSLAEASTGEGDEAVAYSGDISLIAAGTLSSDGVDPNTRAIADVSYNSTAESGDILIEAGSVELFNGAEAYTSASADAFNQATARSGDVDVTALTGAIELDQTINSSATAYGNGSAEAFSGDVTLFAEEGTVGIAGSLYSSAVAEASGDAGATSGDVGVLAMGIYLDSGMDNISSIYSAASALSWGEGAAAATSGEVVLDAGSFSEESGISIAGESSVYSSASAMGGSVATAVSGDMGLFTNGSINFNSAHVYTLASAGTSYVGGDVPASDTADATAGEILVSAVGSFIIDLVSGLDSTAYAYAMDTAAAVSGPLEISAGGDFSVLSASQVYSMAQATGQGAVALAASATAQAGAVSVVAGGDIEIDVDGYDFPVRSEAIAENAQIPFETFGGLSLQAQGDLISYNSLMGDSITAIADSDQDGSGQLRFAGEYLELVGFRHTFQGANDFYVSEGADGSFYLTLDEASATLELYTPVEDAEPLSISIFSTLEETLTVYDLEPRTEYIYLYSAGDLYLYSNLEAQEIVLHADENLNGYGSLYSDTGDGMPALTAEYFSLQSAGDIVFSGEIILCGDAEEPAFGAYLYSDDDGLDGISIRSTAGDIAVETPETGLAAYYNLETLYAAGDIILNAGINGAASGLYLIAGGSIIAGDIEGAHITSAGPVYIYGGSYSYTGEYPDYEIIYSESSIGTTDNPLDVLITGEGALYLISYGEIEGVSAALTGSVREQTTPDAITVYAAPGIVYFNDIPDEEEPVIPEPEPVEEEEEFIAPVGDIMAYEPVVTNVADLDTYQFSSTIGSVYFYHPLTSTDMGAFDQFSVGADAYELKDGQLQLVGHNDLLEFFQAFDEKQKENAGN